jgi:hypothetical protein
MEPRIGLYSKDSPIFRPLLPPEHKTEERMQMASDIFLSYCSADRPLAEQFVSTAAARGVKVWFDEEIEGVRPGHTKRRSSSHCGSQLETRTGNTLSNLI